MIGPAATKGPIPGRARAPTLQSQPANPPRTPPVAAPVVAPSGAFVALVRPTSRVLPNPGCSTPLMSKSAQLLNTEISVAINPADSNADTAERAWVSFLTNPKMAG